jgi:hypothetical protein
MHVIMKSTQLCREKNFFFLFAHQLLGPEKRLWQRVVGLVPREESDLIKKFNCFLDNVINEK